jgi:hypothetical protein
MKVENTTNYIFIKPEDEKEELILRKIIDDNTGRVSLAVSFSGDILGLKVWKTS